MAKVQIELGYDKEVDCPIIPKFGNCVISGTLKLSKLSLAGDDIPKGAKFEFRVAATTTKDITLGSKAIIAPFALMNLDGYKISGKYIGNKKSYLELKSWYKDASEEEVAALPSEVTVVEYFIFPNDNILGEVEEVS